MRHRLVTVRQRNRSRRMETAYRRRCYSECTRDVIFLFQANRESRTKQRQRQRSGDPVPDSKWRTVGVWLDREEAESWGWGQRHNYGEPGWGWRVYGIPAEGELGRILRYAHHLKSRTRRAS